jgi:hypothetical protein
MTKGPPYGENPEITTPDQVDSLTGRPLHFQTTDFTCGPACLMMAMAALDENFTPCPVEELILWREASLIMQGDGPAGCGPYGLARAAMRRDFTVDVYEYKAANIITDLSRKPEEKKILGTITRHDRVSAIAEGCRIHDEMVTYELLARLTAEGRQVIALTFAHEDGHWVVIDDVRGGKIGVLDPNKATPEELESGPYWTDRGRNHITEGDIPHWMQYGPRRSSVLVVLSRKNTDGLLL